MLISKFLVLGGGSAGLLSAIAIKRGLPNAEVRVVRSREIGVIGVGEGTTVSFPFFLHTVMGLPQKEFFARAQPTWKLGIRFLWGPRDEFNYSFMAQTDVQYNEFPRPAGYYCQDDFRFVNVQSSLMTGNKAFPRNNAGEVLTDTFAAGYHIENVKLVAYLEWQATELGIQIFDDKMQRAIVEDGLIKQIELESGETMSADLYIDASGFRTELLGNALKEPFISYADTLFCDRAVVAPREREIDEPIEPYTTAETYDHGWCWRIDHEDHVNRGYVYSSRFVSDEDAEAEYRRKNPKVGAVRVVKFRSGRYQRAWVGNVVAVGNAGGFVEPLEATALMQLGTQCIALVQMLVDSQCDPSPTMCQLHNKLMAGLWDDTRNFLAIHYRFNTRLDTPFWQHCRANTPLHELQPFIDFYTENGPSLIPRRIPFLRPGNPFGLEGHYTLLVGMKVPYQKKVQFNPAETDLWKALQKQNATIAEKGATVKQALQIVRDPKWVWKPLKKPITQ